MFDLTPNQLPLHPFSKDDRPLPEIVADGNPDPDTGWPVFPLAWRDVEGIRYYAIQDRIRGVVQPADARKFWNAMKRRLKKTELETSTWCRHLPYRAMDGKTYQRGHTDAEGQMEYDHARKIVRSDAEFVGKHANAASKRLWIDIPTGRPLLPGKTK